MTCAAGDRKRARTCARSLRVLGVVRAVDVLKPHVDPTDCWTIEVTVSMPTPGIPAEVLHCLGRHGMSLRNAAPQGTHWVAIAIA